MQVESPAAAESNVITPDVFNVQLALDNKQRTALTAGAGALAVANSYVLDPADPESDDLAQSANAELRSIKQRAKDIDEMRLDFVKPAREIIEKAQSRFKPTIDALNEAASILGNKLIGWQQGKERIAAEARRKADEEARRARMEAEQKAAAERAKAEEAERAARQKAAQAEEERQRQAAEAERLRREGDKKAAAEAEAKAKAAAAERAREEEKERVAAQEGERKAREAQNAAAAEAAAKEAAAKQAQPAATKLAGFGARDNWSAELADGKTDRDAILAIAQAIAGVEVGKDGVRTIVSPRPDLLTLVAIDWKAAKKLAGAQKELMLVPCLVARNVPVSVSRKG